MSEHIDKDNTLTAYLGPEFQQRLMWQLLVEPEFAEKIIPDIAVEYFDDPNLKRLFLIILEFIKEFEKVPNLQNQSIHQAINKFKTPNNVIEEESLFSVIRRIELWNERVLNKQLLHDGDVIQKATHTFIRQQEYRKLGEFILDKTKNGDIKIKNTLALIEEKIQKIGHIGDDEDYGTDVTEGIEKALRKEFRQTIPTGIQVIDELTGGGLGKGEIGLILTPSGVGKAQPLTSKILTPNGWIKMGDVKVNDLVIGSDGKSQKVLGVFPQGKRPIYKIEFNDQTTTFCDKEHLWAVNSINQRTLSTKIKGKYIKKPNYTYKPLTVDSLLKNYRLTGKSENKLNYRIPIIQPVNFNEKNVLIHPYVIGAMLGDGYMRDSRITSGDIEIINNIKKFYDKNISIKQLKNKKNDLFVIRLFKCSNELKKYNLFDKLSNNKFIPDDYKYNSIENRILLLNGLLDTDGYASKNGRIQYCSVSKQLALDVKELILSLGGFCSIREKIPKYKYNNEIRIGQKSYILTLSFSDNTLIPFRLKRKQDRVIYREKYKNNKYISNISYSHEEDAQCIYVENDDHLYVTDDYILTHNTTILTKIANTARELDYNVLQIIFEDTEDQIKRKHYTIWSDVKLSEINDNNDIVIKKVNEKIEQLGNKGRLIIKRMSQEDTTMKDIRSWILRYQKKHGFKFDILVLDYLDCVDSHKKTNDKNDAELVVIKSFEAMAADFDIPSWSALQGGRGSIDQELVESHHTGGSIKRLQKAHFFMSVAKTPDQKEAHLANIRILKARFAQDGQTFKDCIFNNDSMEIIIKDDRYTSNRYKGIKKYGDDEIKKLESKASAVEFHARICDAIPTDGSDNRTVGDIMDFGNNIKEFDNSKNNDIIEAIIVEENVQPAHDLLEIESDNNVDVDKEIHENILKKHNITQESIEDVESRINNVDEMTDSDKFLINTLMKMNKNKF